MDLVVDANILFSTLIKDGMTARIFFLDQLQLFAPEFLLEEFEKYEAEIRKKTHRREEEFNEILKTIRRRVNFIPKEDLVRYIPQANEISPDPKDLPYFAVSLARKIDIWSNDKALKNQERVRVHATHDIVSLLFVTSENGKENNE